MSVSKQSAHEFEVALEAASQDPDKPQPKCAVWVHENPGKPNPWIDWATHPDNREDYERPAPSKKDALDLCDGCPLYNLCAEAAIARPPSHGVRAAGLRFELGRKVK